MARNRNIPLDPVLPEPKDGVRRCDVPGCREIGEHPAPRSPQTLDDRYWFCREHARGYNETWNFYAGMSEREIELHTRADMVGRRPTWPIGCRPLHAMRDVDEQMAAFFEIFIEERAQRHAHAVDADGMRRQLSREEQQAVAELGVDPPVTLERIKQQFKRLAKRHHPDATGGDKEAEERLKQIIQAYNILKKSQIA